MFASAYYVFFIGVFLPALCIRSYFKLKAGAPIPPKPRLFIQILVIHGFLFLLAGVTWRSFGLPLLPAYVVAWKDVALGAAILAVFVGGMYPIWKATVLRKGQEIFKRMPQSPGELRWWALVSLSAGFVEEIVYRGVLFGILYYWLNHWWAAVLLSAAAFALGHSTQGLKATVIIFFMSVVFHGLIRYSGTLYIAMAVHAVYDFIAGFAYMSLGKRLVDSPPGMAENQ
jgi:membrane protease YdiL (CAAX protease family)